MNILEIKTLGIIILIFSVLQGIIVIFSKGSLRFQKPEGGFVVWVYNIINLSILLLITPIISILLTKNILTPFEFLSYDIGNENLLFATEIIGLILFISGNLLLYWTRILLWSSFRLGAVKPSEKDKLILSGPFKIMRHPMYSAVIIMAFGLALLIHSFVIIILTAILAVSIVIMIPVEDRQLVDAYGDEYKKYKLKVKSLITFVY